MSDLLETRFTTVREDRVAYQVVGDGPVDLLYTGGQWGHVDLEWEEPAYARFLRRLAAFSRLIRFDSRGTGLSDPRPDDGQDVNRYWAQELLAVMDAVGSSSTWILATIDGGMLALTFAAEYPERVRGLVLFNTTARYVWAEDYPQGNSPELTSKFLSFTREYYGTERWAIASNPSLVADEQARRNNAKLHRALCSPKVAAERFAAQQAMDARPILDRVRVPTLVLGRNQCVWAPMAQQRYLASRIKDARLVELPGSDQLPQIGDADLVLGHVEEFVTGRRRGDEAERALLTVLFTDIVDSTRLAAGLGDAKWHALLNRHDQLTRDQIALFGGELIERTGDGTLATFDRPGAAIDCAQALHEAMREIGIQLRAGLHTAEVERRDDGRVGGINVHLGARVMAKAAAGEVLVSHVVQGVLLGSRYRFEERGVHELKGVPGQWPLYAVGPGRSVR